MSFNKSILVRLFGFPATLVHGDTLVLDRWLWLRKRLPRTRNGETLLDVGCGSGAFTIGAARRGYTSTGISWDERNQHVAHERAAICNAVNCFFEVLDVRILDRKHEWIGAFDVCVNCENVEHVIDDRKLMMDIVACLKPGGRLLLTTPYFHYKPMTVHDEGPFSKVEDGGHVRRGYLRAMLIELCKESGLIVEEISFCSGFFSQKITSLQVRISAISPMLGWIVILPLRPIPPVFDGLLAKAFGYPHFTICLEAYKPRFL